MYLPRSGRCHCSKFISNCIKICCSGLFIAYHRSERCPFSEVYLKYRACRQCFYFRFYNYYDYNYFSYSFQSYNVLDTESIPVAFTDITIKQLVVTNMSRLSWSPWQVVSILRVIRSSGLRVLFHEASRDFLCLILQVRAMTFRLNRVFVWVQVVARYFPLYMSET
jgi:hypothetical protein